MKILTEEEQSELLKAWFVPEDPYNRDDPRPEYYTQFYPPEQLVGILNFTSAFLEAFACDQACLVVFTDWTSYRPHEQKLIDTMRLAFGESRPFMEAPGHVFGPEERDLATGFFSLGVAFGWTAYLYIESDKTVLYNWEGDIFDFWSDSKLKLDKMRELIYFGRLRYTKGAEPDAAET